METTDISGLSLSITKGGEDSKGDFPEINLEKNEWYPSIISGGDLGKGAYGPFLTFKFELQGEENTIELGGKPCPIIVKGLCNLAKEGEPLSDKSKLYEWYTTILGELEEGESLEPKNLVGQKCYVMVEPTVSKKDPTKKFWNVSLVKSAKKKAVVAPSTPTKNPTTFTNMTKKAVEKKVESNIEDMKSFETTPAPKKSKFDDCEF